MAEQTEEINSLDTNDPSLDRMLDDGAFGTGSGAMSARNAGWYDQYLPEQRYQSYLLAHLALMDHVSNGTIDQLQDEVIAILAWAVVDDEAYTAGLQLLADDEYGDLEFFHDLAYGEGTTVAEGFTYDEIPRFDMDDVEGYNQNLIRKLTDDGSMPIDLQRTSQAYYSPESKAGIVEAGRGFLQTGLDVAEDVVRGAQDTFGDPTFQMPDLRTQRQAENLFYEVSQHAAAPGEKDGALQVAANSFDALVPFALDAAVGTAMLGGAMAMTGGWLSVIGGGLSRWGGTAGQATVNGIVRTLAGTKTAVSTGWKMRTPFGALSLAAAGAGIANDVDRIRSMKLEDLSSEEMQLWIDNMTGEKPADLSGQEHQRWQDYAYGQQTMWRRAVNKPYIQAPFKKPQITDLVDPATGQNTAPFMDQYQAQRDMQGRSLSNKQLSTSEQWRRQNPLERQVPQ